MAQKKIPYLKLVEPPEDIREVRKKGRKIKRKKAEKILVTAVLAALAVCGTYLLLKNETYGQARKLRVIRMKYQIQTVISGLETGLSATAGTEWCS